MSPSSASPSPRRDELVEAAYAYALAHGVGDLTLRPLAAAIGSSPRVLLYLFGSKDGLVHALLQRARDDELGLLRDLGPTVHGDAGERITTVWRWLCAPEHRPLLALWTEVYGRSLVEPEGPWSGFAERTVRDWLGVLTGPEVDEVEATLALAVLRGALLDLLATREEARCGAAVRRYVARR